MMRNDFTPGVTDRGGSASAQKKFQLYEEQCLKAIPGASAKAQANGHLFVGTYGGGGEGTIADSGKKKFENKQARPKKPLPKRNAGKKHPAKNQSHPSRQKVRSSKERDIRGAERSKHSSRPSTSPRVTDGM